MYLMLAFLLCPRVRSVSTSFQQETVLLTTDQELRTFAMFFSTIWSRESWNAKLLNCVGNL